jgi:hypothetical protein
MKKDTSFRGFFAPGFRRPELSSHGTFDGGDVQEGGIKRLIEASRRPQLAITGSGASGIPLENFATGGAATRTLTHAWAFLAFAVG